MQDQNLQTLNHKIVADLKLTKLWTFFAELSNIPRVSRYEQGVRDWLTQFAIERNLDYKVDEIGNFFIYKARQNSDSDKTVLLQQHMDMVCEKDPEINFDFIKDSIVLRKDGDYIYANDTTLGSDNGIGLAATLAILEDQEISHPKIEAVFTMNEESGMDGIMNLDKSLISADYVLNLDTEEEGSVYISSAGSRDIEIAVKPLVKIEIQPALGIKISGFRGGHSGVNISENRLNSNKILGIILAQIQNQLAQNGGQILLCDISGGSKRNAIPRNSQAVIVPKIANQLNSNFF